MTTDDLCARILDLDYHIPLQVSPHLSTLALLMQQTLVLELLIAQHFRKEAPRG